MKRIYEKPEMEVLLLDEEVVRTSPTDNVVGWPESDSGLWAD